MEKKYVKLKKLGEDGYVKPLQSATDLLTPEQIEAELADYDQTDITKIPLGVHVRYFTNKNGVRKYNRGGLLKTNTGMPVFVYLTNGTATWPVQLANTVFFRKLSPGELRKKHNEEKIELDKKFRLLEEQIATLKREKQELLDENEKLLHENEVLYNEKKSKNIIKKKITLN